MNRKKFIANGEIYLAECLDCDYKILFESWNEEDVVWGYNYRLPYSFEKYCEQSKAGNWGAVIIRMKDDRLIGRIGISPGLPDLTITIFKAYRNCGYGTMAFSLGVRYCFEVLKLDRLYAGCYEDNIASKKMLEKCAFQPHPEGNETEKHIFSGEDRLQLDFVLDNPSA